MFVLAEKSLAAWRGKPALVVSVGERIEIALPGGERLRVREKDIESLHPGPVSPQALENGELAPLEGDVRGAWELLRDAPVPLQDLAELLYGEWSPRSAWSAYTLLREGLYFSGTTGAVSARDAAGVEAGERKRDGRQRESQEREQFLARLRANTPELPGDRRFLQDVEALALGSSAKSRTLKDLGRPETPEEAHRLLLAWGVWDPWVNPYPSRLGWSAAAREPVEMPPGETRRDLSAMRAYAIDNEYSADPDDAVSFGEEDGKTVVYVHVADPAASILPGSAADTGARGRGATLYLPEGPMRMLVPEALEYYALGIRDVTPALSFRMVLDGAGEIAETEIFPSLVRVSRLSYAQADTLLAGEAGAAPLEAVRDLAALGVWAAGNIRRRAAAGAVMIDLPDVHIAVDLEGRSITIEETLSGPAAEMVRECMLLAGEGAARWASRRQIAFPFVSQETGDLPASPLPGMAGSWQLRRCMRPRVLSVKPGLHWGLGLDQYAQVTSPLRRYTDLLAHQQIRAALGAGIYAGRTPLPAQEMILALGAGEAAYQVSVQTERASRAHWTAVYLAGRKGEAQEAVLLDRKGSRATVMLPALGLETQVSLPSGGEPNERLRLVPVSVRIPEAETTFQVL